MSIRVYQDDGGSGEASAFVLTSVVRWLQAAANDADTPHKTPAEEEEDKVKMIWFISVSAGVFLCYAYCMVMIVRQHRRNRQDAEVAAPAEGSMFVHEGMIFNLNPTQRRAVLEIIFSSQVSWLSVFIGYSCSFVTSRVDTTFRAQLPLGRGEEAA